MNRRSNGARVLPPWIVRENRLTVVLRVAVYAVTASVFAHPLTTEPAVWAAAIGAVVGAIAGRLVARLRVRLVVLSASSLLGLLVAWALRRAVVGSADLASSLGPARALQWGDIALFGFGSAMVAFGLRAASSRKRIWSVAEVGVVSVSFAQLVLAHRFGSINRPFEIADPILARGGDPTIALLGLGTLATLIVVLVLINESSVVRTFLHLAVLALLLFFVVSNTRMPPPPKTDDGLGVRGGGKDESKNDSKGKGRDGGSGQRPPSKGELDFRDEYPPPSNRAPVAVVVFHDDYSSPNGIYYFRQSALSQFNGRRLVQATRSDVDLDIASAFPVDPTPVGFAPEAGINRYTLETSVALLADHPKPFGLEAPVLFAPSPNPDPGRFRRTYNVRSVSVTSDYQSMLTSPAGNPSWSKEQLAHYTQGPSDSRYAELAQQIITKLPAHLRDYPLARALAVTYWLGKEGTYSLKSKHSQAEDPTAHFLFGDKTGYCVHFAHAAVYLMRTLGLPARVATGYAASESSRQGGSTLLLSDQDAHAWAEVYLDGVGWLVTDVSPERVLDPPPQPPDPDLQRLLGEMARGLGPLPADGSTPLPSLTEWARKTSTGLKWALVLLLGSVLAFFYSVKGWRRLAPWVVGAHGLPRVVYRAELDRLAEATVVRRYGETREAFARRIAAMCPSFAELTALHLAAAFGRNASGNENGSDGNVASLRNAARKARAEVRASVPAWKRWLGVVTPWTWLKAR